jgi:DNA-binding NtrC family response regulator
MDNCGKILVVEDQAGEREALVRFLRTEEYDVIGAPSAAAALEQMHEAPDLVLSDVRLGADNGVDLLKTWKRREPGTPFILMTAFGDIASAVEAVKSGAQDYLVKPINPSELLSKISQCLLTAQSVAAAGGREDHGGVARATALTAPLEQIEREAIERTLEQYGGNRTHAAQALGISVRTLQRKLKAWSAMASS